MIKVNKITNQTIKFFIVLSDISLSSLYLYTFMSSRNLEFIALP